MKQINKKKHNYKNKRSRETSLFPFHWVQKRAFKDGPQPQHKVTFQNKSKTKSSALKNAQQSLRRHFVKTLSWADN